MKRTGSSWIMSSEAEKKGDVCHCLTRRDGFGIQLARIDSPAPESPITLENHPDLVARFGSDGTLKVCDTGKRGEAGYREQGETAENFLMHHDGWGSGGTVRTAGLYLDSPPAAGGFTYFQNICQASLVPASGIHSGC